MKKNPFLTIAVVALLLITGFAVFYFYGKEKRTDGVKPETVTTTTDSLRQAEIFSGDIAYLVKGKLLDGNFKGQYDKIADTLTVLSFGDKLYCITCPYVNNGGEITVAVTADGVIKPGDVKDYVKGYSLYEKRTDTGALNTALGKNDRWIKTYDYLKLAEQGKAAFPTIVIPNGEPFYAMLDWTSFNDKYGNTFSELFTKEIPYPVKDKLIAFFNSDEGKGFNFITTDRRIHEDLIRYGNFTGKDRRETACVLATADDNSTAHWEKLLVYAYNGQAEAYVLYSEDFRDKILIETIQKEEGGPQNLIYMDSDEKQPIPTDALRIKIPNQPDVVLVYNKEFDKMNRYLQMPKSAMANTEEEE